MAGHRKLAGRADGRRDRQLCACDRLVRFHRRWTSQDGNYDHDDCYCWPSLGTSRSPLVSLASPPQPLSLHSHNVQVWGMSSISN